MKTRSSSARDRISELSDTLILNIFRFLQIKDVVRTTILSKRWKNLWTTIPCLEFNDTMMINKDKFRNFVNGVLKSWRGTEIIRFHVIFDSKIEKSFSSDIDSWLHFATEKKVQELILSFPNRHKVSEVKQLYLVTQCLYSCSSLKYLWLRGCDLQIHGNVQWDQLKRLTFFSEDLSENAVDQVLRGSPQLEYLNLSICGSNENMSIRSSSLKTLHIGKYLLNGDDAPSIDTELRLWTPSLGILNIYGVPIWKCLLMDVSSLRGVYLDIDGSRHYGNDFVVEKLGEILPIFEHVEKVILLDWCIKALGAAKEKHMLSPFPNAYFLKLKVHSPEYEKIVGVLEMFPKLRNLVVETTNKSLRRDEESCLKFDRYLPNLSLEQLRTVDVSWTKGDDSIFPLIEILLKYAKDLKKMVLREKRTNSRTPWKSLFMASQKLLKMHRSSPHVKLIFD